MDMKQEVLSALLFCFMQKIPYLRYLEMFPQYHFQIDEGKFDQFMDFMEKY